MQALHQLIQEGHLWLHSLVRAVHMTAQAGGGFGAPGCSGICHGTVRNQAGIELCLIGRLHCLECTKKIEILSTQIFGVVPFTLWCLLSRKDSVTIMELQQFGIFYYYLLLHSSIQNTLPALLCASKFNQ